VIPFQRPMRELAKGESEQHSLKEKERTPSRNLMWGVLTVRWKGGEVIVVGQGGVK